MSVLYLFQIVCSVQCWGMSESWRYYVDYLGVERDHSDGSGIRDCIGRGGGDRDGGVGGAGKGDGGGQGDEKGGGGGGGGGGEGCLHSYRVQWSEPTRAQPVPMATASVYFFLNVQKVYIPY